MSPVPLMLRALWPQGRAVRNPWQGVRRIALPPLAGSPCQPRKGATAQYHSTDSQCSPGLGERAAFPDTRTKERRMTIRESKLPPDEYNREIAVPLHVRFPDGGVDLIDRVLVLAEEYDTTVCFACNSDRT